MISQYKHVIWDWNGTIFCDVELGVEIMNGLLHQRSLPKLTSASYRDVFTIPVKDYYARLGFDFQKEPFEFVGKVWMDEYEVRKFECGLYDGITEVLEEIRKLGIGQSILSAYSQHTLDQMVDHYGLRKYFSHVAGLDNIYAASKLQAGRELIARLGLGKKQAVMVGDTEHDFEVARAMEADCILVANGHQSKTRLEALGVPVVDEVREVVRRLARNGAEKHQTSNINAQGSFKLEAPSTTSAKQQDHDFGCPGGDSR